MADVSKTAYEMIMRFLLVEENFSEAMALPEEQFF